MKTAISIEEETLLPTSLLEDDYFDPETISYTESNINYSLKEKAESFEYDKSKSNFSNQNNSNSDLKEDASEETNDLSKEKDKQNLKKYYFFESNSLNDLPKTKKNFSDEVEEKKWSQKNPNIISKEMLKEPNQSSTIMNGFEAKAINMKKDFPYQNLNARIDNRFNGILNILTNNLGNINNNNFINNKNNINNIKNEEITSNKISSNLYVSTGNNNDFNNLFKKQNQLIDINNDFENRFNNINIDYNYNVNNNINLNKYNLFQPSKSIFPNSLSNPGKENINIYNNSSYPKYLYDFKDVNKNYLFYNFNQKTEEEKFKENVYNNGNKSDFLLQSKEYKAKIINEFKQFIEELKPSLVDYICSRDGSKIIQQKLNIHKNIKIKFLLKKIITDFEKIICDKYGNYFFQKLYIISSKKLRIKILNSIKIFFISASKDETGVYVIQKIIEEVQSEEEKKLILEYIKGKEMELALNKEGTHIIQKIIQIFSEKERQDLTDVLCNKDNIQKLLQDSNGINVIKRIISFKNIKSNRIKLLEALNPNIYSILRSLNGSNIIYYLLEDCGIDIGINFVNILLSNFEIFSTNKYSSKLIYKIIQLCINKCSLSLSIYNNNRNLSNFVGLNEQIILNNFKAILFEPNKISNIYKNKYAKDLIIKIRNILTFDENKIFYSFMNSLKFLNNDKYELYVEIFK